MTVTKVRLLWMDNNFQDLTGDFISGLEGTRKVVQSVILLAVVFFQCRSEDEFLSSVRVDGEEKVKGMVPHVDACLYDCLPFRKSGYN